MGFTSSSRKEYNKQGPTEFITYRNTPSVDPDSLITFAIVDGKVVDWRKGERHFMRHLVDGDLANNNGGWQWAASTGTDAAPYFRVFNPYRQAARFDPDGAFIRAWVPELEPCETRDLHDPKRLDSKLRRELGYPDPIVDEQAGADRAVAAFRAARPRRG